VGGVKQGERELSAKIGSIWFVVLGIVGVFNVFTMVLAIKMKIPKYTSPRTFAPNPLNTKLFELRTTMFQLF
jgi:hypothetical protein